MARTTIVCATEGCTAEYDVHGNNRRDADYRAKKLLERGWTCRACDNRAAIARAEASGLPTLEGSEKQVVWAATLREARLRHLDTAMPLAMEFAAEMAARVLSWHASSWDLMVEGLAEVVRKIGPEAAREALEAIRAETDAKWWIDHREDAPAAAVAAVASRLSDEAHALSVEGKAAAVAEQDAMAEATLRPAEPVSETIAELASRDGRLVVAYDERSDALAAVVKRLGFGWDPAARVWVRTHAANRMGPATDRLAETAHELLAAGIVVAVHDPAVRAMAAERTYSPEHTRWITVAKASGKDRFRLHWGRDEDHFRAFKSLPGSRYADKACTVPQTSRDALLDFAEANGFRLTAAAQALADAVMATRERGQVVAATARPTPDVALTKAAGSRPDHLEIPESVEVDSDLVDAD